jgi:hypothetical protein
MGNLYEAIIGMMDAYNGSLKREKGHEQKRKLGYGHEEYGS